MMKKLLPILLLPLLASCGSNETSAPQVITKIVEVPVPGPTPDPITVYVPAPAPTPTVLSDTEKALITSLDGKVSITARTGLQLRITLADGSNLNSNRSGFWLEEGLTLTFPRQPGKIQWQDFGNWNAWVDLLTLF